jgi:UDP-N-acetylmuramyl pentapeptide synthase
LQGGGSGAWAERDRLWVGSQADRVEVGIRSRLRAAHDGRVAFLVHNALFAAGIARVCGLGGATISAALQELALPSRLMPGSFNVVALDGVTVVVDRPAPSWFLRPSLRAVSHLAARRTLIVAGRLDQVPESDLFETGRLLGRSAGAIILHGDDAVPERAKPLRQGIAANRVPPVIVHVPSESRAIGRLLRLAQPGDVGFVLANDPAGVLRSLERARARRFDEAAPDQR